MKQGTVSILIGCHSPVHSFLVALSWRRLHNRWPRPWQLGCIMLHDVGHLGTDYLDSLEEKQGHWVLGARIAGKIFGEKGYKLVAGHCPYSGEPESDLYRPDKYSWYLAPRAWVYWNDFVEPKIRHGLPRRESVNRFKEQVRQNIESGAYRSNHEIYLERIGQGKGG